MSTMVTAAHEGPGRRAERPAALPAHRWCTSRPRSVRAGGGRHGYVIPRVPLNVLKRRLDALLNG
jgi:hypothetical protein